MLAVWKLTQPLWNELFSRNLVKNIKQRFIIISDENTYDLLNCKSVSLKNLNYLKIFFSVPYRRSEERIPVRTIVNYTLYVS